MLNSVDDMIGANAGLSVIPAVMGGVYRVVPEGALDAGRLAEVDSLITGHPVTLAACRRVGLAGLPASDGHRRVSLDLGDFRLAMVKMAYLMAVDRIPGYAATGRARWIADVLNRVDVRAVDEDMMRGPGIVMDDSEPMLLEEYVDYSKPRHVMALLNVDGALYGFVRLFDCFVGMVRLADEPYGMDDRVLHLALNDYRAGTVELLDAVELSDRIKAVQDGGGLI